MDWILNNGWELLRCLTCLCNKRKERSHELANGNSSKWNFISSRKKTQILFNNNNEFTKEKKWSKHHIQPPSVKDTHCLPSPVFSNIPTLYFDALPHNKRIRITQKNKEIETWKCEFNTTHTHTNAWTRDD